jgi:hypothetical protein
MNPKRLSVEQVAERLAVSTRQVNRLIEAGELKAFNVSLNRDAKHKKHVVDIQDLEEFEQSRRTGQRITTPKPKRQKKTEYPVYTSV